MPQRELYRCPMCGRLHIHDHMTIHHLLPTVENVAKGEPVIYVCRTCHDVIHYCHSNKDLRFNFNTLELLMESEKIRDMIELYRYKADNCVFKIKRLKRLLCEQHI